MNQATTVGAALAALFLALPLPVRAAPMPSPSSETARLAGLCRVWGVVKYFHPYLAYQPIDWDRSLVQAIPKVRAAKTASEYADAVDSMLATLHDPNTHVVRPPASPLPASTVAGAGGPAQIASKQPSVKIEADGTAIVTATDYDQFMGYEAIGAVAKALQGTRSARALVFDLRRRKGAPGGADYGSFILSQALIRTLPGLLARDLALPVSRHRMHMGYAPADGDDHGGYYSAFVTPQGRTLPAQGDIARPARSMAFIVNAGSADIHDILGGLQAARLATVVQEGPTAGESGGEETGVGTYPMTLPDGVEVVVRLTETVNPGGTLGFRPDISVPMGSAPGSDPAMAAALQAVRMPTGAAPVNAPPAGSSLYGAALPDSSYADTAFPASEYRLLALFRFWNIVQYVYPYKDIIGRPWGDVLAEYIPQMEADTDAHAYGVTAAKMIAEMRDSHVDAFIPALFKETRWTPPVFLREVQGHTVIAALPDPKAALGLHVGDIVTSVDGEQVAARRARLGSLYAASTPQALSYRVSSVLLGGLKTVPAGLTVEDAAGATRTVSLPRTERYVLPPDRATPVYGVLPSGLGYIDLGRLTPQDVDKAFAAVAKTPGLIFDMRGYPNGTAWAVAPYLASRPVVGARVAVPERHSPDDASVSREEQPIQPNPDHHYVGRVAVLIDESAISQAEHTCLFLEAACHPAFVGTPTEGANGEVTNAVLPGGISFSFTGMSITHGDGRQLQRVGIQPTLRVAPTVAGIRAGRDEILEAAVKLLARSAPAPTARVRAPAAPGRRGRRG